MRLAKTFVTTLIVSLFAICLWLAPRPAAAGNLDLELNKIADGRQGCVATILIGNKLGRTLNLFRLDLVLFDAKGVLFDRVLIDLAPLPHGRTTITNFPLVPGSCAGVSRILLQDIPACRADGQANGAPKDLDCLAGLTVRSRTNIDFGM